MSTGRITNRSRAVTWRRSLCLAAPLLVCVAIALACDTPVYQYTMENWERDQYLVRYFHKGAEAPGDTKANDYLRRVGGGLIEQANLSFATVDVNDPGALATPVHRRIWEGRGSRQLPFHVIISPKGHEVFAGRLSEADARALVTSPGRTRLSQELARGTHGALLLVTGSSAAETATAREAVSKVIKSSVQRNNEVALVEVKRDDPAERWLIRQVMVLESDLKDLDNAMVFPVFGRGHLLEPYLGKGINERNLNEVIAFMNGPCACEVKSASIGMDLLTNFDWAARRAGGGGAATAPSFALFDIQEAPATEPVCAMPTAPRATGAPASAPPAAAERSERATRPDRTPAPDNSGGGGGSAPNTSPLEPEATDTIPAMGGGDGGGFADAGQAIGAFSEAAAPAGPAAPDGAAGAPLPASEERELASGPDLVAASRPMPADLATVEGTGPLATRLSLVLGLAIAGGALAVLLIGTFLVLRPRKQQ